MYGTSTLGYFRRWSLCQTAAQSNAVFRSGGGGVTGPMYTHARLKTRVPQVCFCPQEEGARPRSANLLEEARQSSFGEGARVERALILGCARLSKRVLELAILR